MRKATDTYNLQVVKPNLAKQWHPTKNGRLRPKDFTPGSGKPVWWQCSKGHEWKAVINDRNRGYGCPYCAGLKLCPENSLKTRHPELVKEWHPTKNGNLKPKDVTFASGKRVWWKCRFGHEWETRIRHRTTGSGCPICKGRRVTSSNCLSNVNPKLAKQWHRERNDKLTPKDVAPNSRMKVWWKCGKGHEWQAAIHSRNSGAGCPYCAGKRACHDNCLLTQRPDVAGEWHPTKNGDLTPKDVTVNSNKQIWWQCQRGHEWQAMITRRSHGTDCPHCRGIDKHEK